LCSLARGKRAHRQLLSHHHQRLHRLIEIEELSVHRAREQLIAADEQRERSAVADGFVEPDPEDVAQRRQ
jgi:hypothetical protein